METFIENNKLIAEFMGLTIITDGINYFDTDYKPLKNYQSNWSDLMPVVLTINSIQDIKYSDSGNYSVTIGSDYVCIDPPIGDRVYFSGNGIEDRKKPIIDKVYNGVIKFINWYNSAIQK